MALTGLHTNWLTGSYAGDREYVLKGEKGTEGGKGDRLLCLGYAEAAAWDARHHL